MVNAVLRRAISTREMWSRYLMYVDLIGLFVHEVSL